MNPALDFINEWLTPFSSFVAALATIVLCYLTKVLASETRKLANSSSQPHVVISLEPNTWSMIHFDIIVENVGNAPAYEVKSKVTPLFELDTYQSIFPYSEISLIRPNQVLRSYLTPYKKLEDKCLNIEISWKRHPTSKDREGITYKFDMKTYDGVTSLGGDPKVKISDSLKSIAETNKKELPKIAQEIKNLRK